MRGRLFVVAAIVVATMALGSQVSAQSVSGPTIHNVTLHEGSGMLTITGVGFGRDPVVTVDGQTVVVMQGGSESQLDVLAPAALLTIPGSYRLTVQDPVTQISDAFVVAAGHSVSTVESARAPTADRSNELPLPHAADRRPANPTTVGGPGSVAPVLLEGNSNTAVGNHAFASNTTGHSNTAVGAGALFANTTGRQNSATGNGALTANITGHDNTADGFRALEHNTTGEQNTASAGTRYGET